MKLLFKQRFFSWFDSYDIYDEAGNVVFVVKGVLSFGHCLQIFDASGNKVGYIQEEVLTFLPKFQMYAGESYIGEIKKEFTFFEPVYSLDFNDWTVQGDLFQWDYDVMDGTTQIMHASKKNMEFYGYL